jgi:hypothetical protein
MTKVKVLPSEGLRAPWSSKALAQLITSEALSSQQSDQSRLAIREYAPLADTAFQALRGSRPSFSIAPIWRTLLWTGLAVLAAIEASCPYRSNGDCSSLPTKGTRRNGEAWARKHLLRSEFGDHVMDRMRGPSVDRNDPAFADRKQRPGGAYNATS